MATIHLDGAFGAAREPIDADFPYFGQRIRIHPEASDLYQVELMAAAENIDLGDIDFNDPSTWTPEQNAAMRRGNDAALAAIRGQIHHDDWELFLATAKANRQQTLDLMELSQKLTGLIAGFPTSRSAGSSGGRESTGHRLTGDASSPAPRRAMRLLSGRPDLQSVVVDAAEYRARAS